MGQFAEVNNNIHLLLSLMTMKLLLRITLLALVLFTTQASTAQPGVQIMDALCYYPGDFDALYRIISERIVYPKSAKKKGIEGTVFVKFLVDHTGHTSNHTIYTSVSPGLDAEAMRIVRTIDGFVPARVGGLPVSSEFVLQVKFQLPKETAAPDKKKKTK